MKVQDGMTPEERDAHAKLEAKARDLAWELDRKLNPAMTSPRDAEHRTIGFALLVFPFGDNRATTYISNGDRESMIRAIEQWLAHAKRKS